MASKFGMAGGIPERRVRPIWDAVDSRQFKSALKLCTALLAKYPSSPYALALKALTLERMGKPEEALTICLNAKQQLHSADAAHVDDLTLSTLQIVFQRLDHLDLATSCYEHACEKYPNNLELMMGLFNCYVREYSFVKQQQTAIKMYKIVGEERFLLWAVCSIQLQVLCSRGGDKLLSLSEALLKKHISSHSLHEPEALLIYISILEQQAKYVAALDILSGSLGSLIAIEVDKLRMQGRLLARAGDFAAAANTFQKVLESCPDDWESFLHYLDCVLEEKWRNDNPANMLNLSQELNACKISHLTEELFDCRISDALIFVEKLQLGADGDPIRCPYLAKIEIERRRLLKGKTGDGRLVEALLEYFYRFSHLACFSSDIEVFLDIVTQEEKMELLDQFAKYSESFSSTPIKRLGHAVTVFKLQELFGAVFKFPSNELRGNAIRMVEMYGRNLVLSKDLDPQENVHGEDLLCMACNTLVQLFWRTNNFGYLLEAIMVLEFGLSMRRSTWQYKILLLHLYCYLGAIPLAVDWYKSMDVKNILLETVIHHILPQMLKSPLWLDLDDLIRDYLKFMDDYMREAADLTFLAYRHRNYSKVIEFVQFKEQLQHSHQYMMTRVEVAILQMKQNSDNLAELEGVLENLNKGIQLFELSNFEYKSLTFNYDLQTRPWWSPTLDANYLLGSFEAETVLSHKCRSYSSDDESDVRKAVERRSLLPRLVYLSIHMSSSLLKENTEANASATDGKIDTEFKSLLDRYSSSLGHTFDECIKIIAEISEGQESFQDFGLDMVYWMNFAIFFNAWNCSHPFGSQSYGDISSSWNIVDSLVKKCTTKLLASPEPILDHPGSSLPVLVQLVSESYSWHLVVIQSCLRSMVPTGKKKKKGGNADQLHLPLLKSIQDSISSLNSAMEDVRIWLQVQINQSDDECLEILLGHLQKEHEEGPGEVIRSLEEIVSANCAELGDRISQAAQSWSSTDVARKVIRGQRSVLTEFHKICSSKLKLLGSLKLSV